MVGRLGMLAFTLALLYPFFGLTACWRLQWDGSIPGSTMVARNFDRPDGVAIVLDAALGRRSHGIGASRGTHRIVWEAAS